jgi:hypothetical protein
MPIGWYAGGNFCALLWRICLPTPDMAAKIGSSNGNTAGGQADMNVMKRKRELIPRWDMPSDPVKAVFWFLHWLLKVLVRFFYIAVLVGVVWESILNGWIGGIVTLLVGLGVWAGLGVMLLLFNIGMTILQGISSISRMQQDIPPYPPFHNFDGSEGNSRIVEGTVTDLEEERRKRRQE